MSPNHLARERTLSRRQIAAVGREAEPAGGLAPRSPGDPGIMPAGITTGVRGAPLEVAAPSAE